MTEPSEIGMRVKQLRVKKHMTQKALAERSGVSWSFISRLENWTKSMQASPPWQKSQALWGKISAYCSVHPPAICSLTISFRVRCSNSNRFRRSTRLL